MKHGAFGAAGDPHGLPASFVKLALSVAVFAARHAQAAAADPRRPCRSPLATQ